MEFSGKWVELNKKKAEQDGVMIARRNSGGGTVRTSLLMLEWKKTLLGHIDNGNENDFI